MSVAAKLGTGTQVQFKTGSPLAFTTIPGVKSAKFGGIEVATVDITNMDSPVLGGIVFKEYIGGLADGKEVDVEFIYLASDSTQAALQAAQDGTVHLFQIVVRDMTVSPATTLKTMSFSAFVQNWSIPDFTPEKEVMGSIKLKISGTIAFA